MFSGHSLWHTGNTIGVPQSGLLSPDKGATIRLPGGGTWVFQSGQNIFFCHFQGQNIFFQNYHEPEYFFSSHTGPEYFFLYNKNLEATFQLSRKSFTKLLY